MKSYVIALAALAAIGSAGTAYAGEVTKPTPMTDEQMDQVTAGAEQVSNFGMFTSGRVPSVVENSKLNGHAVEFGFQSKSQTGRGACIAFVRC
jgi:hypothetical protein